MRRSAGQTIWVSMMLHRTFLSNEPSQRGIWLGPDLVQTLFLSSYLHEFWERGTSRDKSLRWVTEQHWIQSCCMLHTCHFSGATDHTWFLIQATTKTGSCSWLPVISQKLCYCYQGIFVFLGQRHVGGWLTAGDNCAPATRAPGGRCGASSSGNR